MQTLTIFSKATDFYKAPVLARSDKIPLCKLIGNFSDPVIPDPGRLFKILILCFFKIIVIANPNPIHHINIIKYH